MATDCYGKSVLIIFLLLSIFHGHTQPTIVPNLAGFVS